MSQSSPTYSIMMHFPGISPPELCVQLNIVLRMLVVKIEAFFQRVQSIDFELMFRFGACTRRGRSNSESSHEAVWWWEIRGFRGWFRDS